MNRVERRTIEAIVTSACRAPSVHNSQPWQWTYDGEHLNLYADWSRQVRHGDPDRRDLEISCGAALHHAVVAASAAGFHTTVHRVPDPDDARLLASISVRETGRPPAAGALAKAIYQRHTDRRTPSSTPVPESCISQLVQVGADRGAFVVPIQGDDQTLVKDLRHLAVLLQHDDDEYVAELGQWTHALGDDGVPDTSVLAHDEEASRFSTESRFPAGVLRDRQPTEADQAPTWMVVATSSDDSMSRVRAGEALSAMLLHATTLDLVIVPFTQAVEVDATRSRLEERFLGGGKCLQLILRVAVPPAVRPPVPMTRRRSIEDVLTVREPSDLGAS